MRNVAIITPCQRVDDFLLRACTSLRDNSSKGISITHFVIFDNVDPEEFYFSQTDDYRLVLLKNSGPKGPSATRNVGISFLNEKFDFFGFLDSDDFLSQNYIHNCIRELEHSSSTFIFGQGRSVLFDGKLANFSNVPIKAGVLSKILILVNIIGCPSGVIVKNSLKNRTVLFDTDLRYFEDYLYYLSLLMVGNVFLKSEELYFYQLHPFQATSFSNIDALEDQITLFKLKISRFRFGLFEKLLINERLVLSSGRLGRRFKISSFVAIVFISLFSPRWFLGRLRMLRKV